MNKLLLIEKAFSIIMFTLFSGGILAVILSGGASQGDGLPDPDLSSINIIFLGLYLITFFLIILRWRKVLLTLYQGGLIWLLIGFTISSIIWSFTPNLTSNRLIALCGTALFSLYFSSRYTIKEQLEIIGWTMGIGAILSLIFAVALPAYGQMTGIHNGLWRGIYYNKNGMGKIMGIGTVIFLILAQRKGNSQWICWGLSALSLFLLVMSKASSPLLNLGIVMMAFFLLQILRWQYALMVPVIAGISLAGVAIQAAMISNADTIAETFGKDMTFTGRTDLWPLVIDKIQEQLWVGYGFGAFWNGLDGPSRYVWSSIDFAAPNAHNGYLDLLLELGVVGFALYALQFFVCLLNSMAYVRFDRTADGLWPALLLLYIILSNLTESGLYIQNNIFLVLQLSIFLSLGLVQNEPQEEELYLEEIE